MAVHCGLDFDGPYSAQGNMGCGPILHFGRQRTALFVDKNPFASSQFLNPEENTGLMVALWHFRFRLLLDVQYGRDRAVEQTMATIAIQLFLVAE